MKGILITVYDGKADTYTPPHVAETNAAAIRQFAAVVNDTQHTMLSDHPEDFTLFRIASFAGPAVTGEDRVALANGLDVKVKPEVK